MLVTQEKLIEYFLKLHNATTYKGSHIVKWVENVCFLTFLDKLSLLYRTTFSNFKNNAMYAEKTFKTKSPCTIIHDISKHPGFSATSEVALAQLIMHLKRGGAHD